MPTSYSDKLEDSNSSKKYSSKITHYRELIFDTFGENPDEFEEQINKILTKNEIAIFKLVFYENQNFSETGEVLEKSRQYVHACVYRGLNKLGFLSDCDISPYIRRKSSNLDL